MLALSLCLLLLEGVASQTWQSIGSGGNQGEALGKILAYDSQVPLSIMPAFSPFCRTMSWLPVHQATNLQFLAHFMCLKELVDNFNKLNKLIPFQNGEEKLMYPVQMVHLKMVLIVGC